MATREERKSRRAARRAKRKDKIASFRGDGNALKDKFGIGRSLSNRFDQRVGDALTDLISGAIGTRVSNIPSIEQEIKNSRAANRDLRAEALKSPSRAHASRLPNPTNIIVFPEQYFGERGDSLGTADKNEWDLKINRGGGFDHEITGGDPLPDDITYHGGGTVDGGFPNSIHFRSLPRPKVDTSESAWLAQDNEHTKQGLVNPLTEDVYDIFLYLPHDLGDAVKVTYESADAGMADVFFARLFSGDTDTTGLTGGDRGLDTAEMMRMVRGMLPGGAIIQRAAGAMTNPMKFQSFTGVDFRTYSYKFTLKPSSVKEAEDIRHIVHAFKHSTLPGTAGNNDRIWTLPNEWLIKFQGPIAKWIDFPLTVVCTGVDVNYSAGGTYTLMEDGSPQAIDLTVSFTETTQLSRQKYMQQVSAHNWSKRTPADSATRLVSDQIDTGKADVVPVKQEEEEIKTGVEHGKLQLDGTIIYTDDDGRLRQTLGRPGRG